MIFKKKICLKENEVYKVLKSRNNGPSVSPRRANFLPGWPRLLIGPRISAPRRSLEENFAESRSWPPPESEDNTLEQYIMLALFSPYLHVYIRIICLTTSFFFFDMILYVQKSKQKAAQCSPTVI